MTNKIKDIRRLTRLARKLWASLVKMQYNGKCAVCRSTEYINAHHIESYRVCKALRFDPHNGILLCAKKHHKFSYPAAHTSWILLYKVLKSDTIFYLQEHYLDPPPEITVEYLETVINNLKERIQHVEESSKNNNN